MPRSFLSRLVARVAGYSASWLSQPLIRAYMRCYGVGLHDAERKDPREYSCLRDFFTRRLAPGSRPMHGILSSPCDGIISAVGTIHAGQILQAKGRTYGVGELLGSQEIADEFTAGKFITIYLSPADYHRVHAPIDFHLHEARYIPGRLFSVSPRTTARTERLFCRNRRLVMLGDCALGSLALVMVGALIVGAIHPAWNMPAEIACDSFRERVDFRVGQDFGHGAELGTFEFGSTVILLLSQAMPTMQPALQVTQSIRLGQALI